MSKSEWKKSIGIAGARVLLAFVFLFSQTVWGGQSQQTKEEANTPQNATAQPAVEKQAPAATTAKPQTAETQGETLEKGVAEEKPSGDGSHEGIRVHGHWTIEVRNPDGALVTHREFENSLAASGSQNLTQILGRQTILGQWNVELDGPNGATTTAQPCADANGQGHPCDVAEPNFGYFGCNYTPTCTTPSFPYLSHNLSLAVNNSTLVLTGSVVSAGGSVNGVQTQLVQCFQPLPSTFSTLGCNSDLANIGYGSISSITSTTIVNSQGVPSPISVSAGQTVAVTVVISFS